MFYDVFKALCDEKGVSCKKAALEIGLSNSIPTAWKKRGITPKGDTLEKIADYFHVTTDYLLGKETSSNGKQIRGYTMGMSGGGSQPVYLTKDEYETLLAMLKALRERKEDK